MTLYYRFRSVERLLGPSQELQTQTIYFAQPRELNDPMEGLAKLYWQGDEVTWGRLIEHFMGCSMTAYFLYKVQGDVNPLTWAALPWYDPIATAPSQLTNSIRRLIEEFLASERGRDLIAYLSAREEVCEDELHFHLNAVHPVAVDLLQQELASMGLLSGAPDPPPSPAMPPYLKELEALHQQVESGAAASVFDMFSRARELERLKMELADGSSITDNHRFINQDFIPGYFEHLRKLAFPQWSTACFMDSYANMSVWGHYASSHTGACLVFNATLNKGVEGLSLVTPASPGPLGNGKSSSTFLPFKKVQYEADVQRVNFFTSIGRLPAARMRQFWFRSRAGIRSELESKVFADQNAWRNRYWSSHLSSITRKSLDWAYEREYRLALYGTLRDLGPPEMRLLKYDFNDLAGIIFGLNMAQAEKVQIIQLLREKCSSVGRRKFGFYQAYRAESPDRISSHPLHGLMPEPSEWLPD